MVDWKGAWEAGHTPWDRGAAPQALVDLVGQGVLPQGRALVPGAGSGYDVLTLANPEREAIGLDLAEGARERFEMLRKQAGVPSEQARLVVADFFTWEPEEPFDMIWDYKFFCALERDRRPEWVERMQRWVKPGGELVTLIFPGVDKPADDGPPYAMTPELLHEVLTPAFEPIYLEEIANPHPDWEARAWVARWRRREF